jgi:tryptophan synthase beta subunit
LRNESGIAAIKTLLGERFGGRFVPEALIAALDELNTEYLRAKTDAGFNAELAGLLASDLDEEPA